MALLKFTMKMSAIQPLPETKIAAPHQEAAKLLRPQIITYTANHVVQK